ncbi:MAG TPA: DNA polymerase ligase N-terminal domain-containing protein, partial [Acidimicrobiales bacterium]
MSEATERLEKYRSMRDFSVTAEPAGAETAPPRADGAPRFVVQRHRARRLHYDVRLEVRGVLVSWAVPKGPSLDPARKQLAVHVEDHPIEYFDFEGVIPKGEYGGGDVVVWDWGTWRLTKGDDAGAAIESGELHFDLTGEKLRGHFMLIRRDRDQSGKEQWLLFHKKDEFAQEGWDPEDHPRSVKTGRTNDEVAAAPTALWRSDRPASEASVALVEAAPPSWEAPASDELAALDDLKTAGTWVFQGRELRLTNLDKVLFPARNGGAPVTKRDLIRYHALVAPSMLPYLYDRPINSHRYPDGVDRPGFWHKEVPGHAPEWLRQWHNDEADPGETECYAVVDSPPALVWMANFGAL